MCETERVGESQRRTERNLVRKRQREGESGKEYECKDRVNHRRKVKLIS